MRLSTLVIRSTVDSFRGLKCLNRYLLKLKLGRQVHVFGCFACGCNFSLCANLVCWCLCIWIPSLPRGTWRRSYVYQLTEEIINWFIARSQCLNSSRLKWEWTGEIRVFDFLRIRRRSWDVESNWDLLATHLRSILDKHIPMKLTSTRHNVPWLTSSVKMMCRKKRRLFRRAKKTQEPRHKEAFKTVQNETRKPLKKAHWSYVYGILSDRLENGDT